MWIFINLEWVRPAERCQQIWRDANMDAVSSAAGCCGETVLHGLLNTLQAFTSLPLYTYVPFAQPVYF